MALNQIPVQTINTKDVVPSISYAPQANTTGQITSSTSTITATDLMGIGSVTVAISGTFSSVVLVFEYSPDNGSTWYLISGQNAATGATATSTGGLSAPASFNVSPLLGADQFRVRATSYGSGPANVVIHPSTQFIEPWVTMVGNLSISSVVPGVGAINLGKAEDAAHGSGDSGVFMLGVRNDNGLTTFTSANGDYIGQGILNNGAVYLGAVSSGGYTPGKLISAASTNATVVKASAGTLGYVTASNINASPRYLKIYNTASAPTVGTTVPVQTFLIPGGTTGAGTNIPLPPQGIALGTGISFAITSGVADSDTGAISAAEVVVNYGFN